MKQQGHTHTCVCVYNVSLLPRGVRCISSEKKNIFNYSQYICRLFYCWQIYVYVYVRFEIMIKIRNMKKAIYCLFEWMKWAYFICNMYEKLQFPCCWIEFVSVSFLFLKFRKQKRQQPKKRHTRNASSIKEYNGLDWNARFIVARNTNHIYKDIDMDAYTFV